MNLMLKAGDSNILETHADRPLPNRPVLMIQDQDKLSEDVL